MPPFDWSLPYPSQRMPVLARNVVATSQPLAAQAGLRMLQQGGNAVDAALAAAITLTVVEPTSNGIGADAFAILFHEGKLHGLNASGRSPMAWTPELFADMKQLPALGWPAVTVPGAVSAWVTLSDRFGRMPFHELFETAITYASEGFLVSPLTAASWSRAADRYADFPEFCRTFLPQGRAPRPGEQFICEQQAETLERIAETHGRSFYKGKLAQRIAADSAANGGLMTVEDLAAHECDWVDPLSIDYRGFTLHEIPPNGQGLAALIALGILAHRSLGDLPVDSTDSLHLQIEAMKLALADAHRYIADPATMDINPASLLDHDYLQSRAELIDIDHAADPGHGQPQPSSTVYLAAADESGSMVSFIQSNFEGFGSGIVIPGAGISMQNRAIGFTLEQGHPNQIGPGKRPFHTIIPGFVTRRDNAGNPTPVMAFGVMGGHMQAQGHVQVVIRLADYGQNPQAALDAPRWRIEAARRVTIEPGFDPDVYEQLRQRDHDVLIAEAKTVHHGGGQAVFKLDDGYLAASDMRRDGSAVGF